MPIKWFGNQVKKFVNRKAQLGTESLAYDVRENARRNLIEGGHIDTKFLYNSIYVATPNGHSPIHPDGTYTSLKDGSQVVRRNGPVAQVSEGAFVGAAAEYAIYVELKDSFLYRALEETAGASDKVMSGLYIND